MSPSLKWALQSRRFLTGIGAVIVGVATLYAIQSGEMSGLLFLMVLLSSGITSLFGEAAQGALTAVVVLVAVLLFLAPLFRLRATAGEVARFRLSAGLWLLVYPVALLWFGAPGQYLL
jgi:hypothetical protein